MSGLRVTLSSRLMDELMNRAYVSYFDPFRELIANAWDADATRVNIDTGADSITVTDDGFGISDFAGFLTKGESAKEGVEHTPLHGRQPVGEKGLGFLSVFKIAALVEVYSRPADRTHHLVLTEAIVRASIDHGTPIPLEEVEDTISYGTRIVLQKLRRIFTPSRVHEYLQEAFTPLLSHSFRILVNGREVAPRPLPPGTLYHQTLPEGEITLVDPTRVEERQPVRFYNRGVLVRREVFAARPHLTGYVNTNLTLATGRATYVEDDAYLRLRRALDRLINATPVAYGPSSLIVQRTLNKLARVLERALPRLDLPTIPPEFRVHGINESAHTSQVVVTPPGPEDNGGPAPQAISEVRLRAATPAQVRVRKVAFGAVKEEALSPDDRSVLVAEHNIIINVSHPHVAELATLAGRYRDLTLMPLVAEGFVELLHPQTADEYCDLVDRVLRAMLREYDSGHGPRPLAPA